MFIKKKVLIVGALNVAVIIGIILLVWLLTGKRNDSVRTDRATAAYQNLASKTSLPVYTTSKTLDYPFVDASSQDGAIIISSYTSKKGVINVTQQARPTIDPFGQITAADTFATSIGDARIFPDNSSAPYVIVQTPITWIIIRSTSEQVLSSDLKEFSLSLREVPRPATN